MSPWRAYISLVRRLASPGGLGANFSAGQAGPSQASTPASSADFYEKWGFLGPIVSPAVHNTIHTTPPGRSITATLHSPETDLVSYAQVGDEA